MTYQEAIVFLYSLRLFGAKFGLENTLRLAELAGNPQSRLRFIHVAGTNGKGSTCAMLESIYRAAGLRTGLFTSPHLVSFCERLQVNRVPVPEAEVARLVSELKPLFERFAVEAHPTFFEVITVMALKYFHEQKCEIVIWEVGLGGRLDATNIVSPLVSVITNVQYDHQEWLGESLDKIASEKAGIIKRSVPVVSACDAPEALRVIEKIAAAQNAPLTIVSASTPSLEGIELPLLGRHQRLNAAVAIATANLLQNIVPVSEEALRNGLQTVRWPGRLQIITTGSGQKIVLDGAHNVDGAKVLRQAIEELFPTGPDVLIMGMLRDKDCEKVCGVLAPIAGKICVCPVESERTADSELLAQLCSSANPAASVLKCESLADALQQAAEAPFVLITGSLYFVGQALEVLKLMEIPSGPERALNDWRAL